MKNPANNNPGIYPSEIEVLDARFDWVGPPNKLSNIRPIRLKQVLNESQSEIDYRKSREALNQWNCDFWSSHNQLFEIRKEQFYNERKKAIGRLEHVSAEDFSVFYKDFLTERAPIFSAYNKEWYNRNLQLIIPAVRVNFIRLKRLLLRI